MSIDCTHRVWEHSNQKGSALLLLLAIADCADENGLVCAGLGALAARIRMSGRQTLRLIAHLEDAAELLVLRRAGRGNLYVVCTGADRKDLAAALDRAASFTTPLPGSTPERSLAFLEAPSVQEGGTTPPDDCF